MDRVQIEIQDSDNSILGVLEVGNVKNFPLSLTTSIADLRDITTRSGSFSVSFKVPSTKENDSLLEHIYLSDQKNYKDFDAEKDCVIRVNGLDIESGKVQITKINSLGRADANSYSFKFFGNNMGWVLKMKGKKTKDLPYLDKTLVYGDTEVQASWLEEGGNDEPVYSVINRGERIDPDMVNVSDLRADYFALDYLRSAFNMVGYNFQSDHFESTDQKKLYIPFFGKNWKIEQDEIDDAFANVKLTSNTTNIDLTIPFAPVVNGKIFSIQTLLTNECSSVSIVPPNQFYTSAGSSASGSYTEITDTGNNFSGGSYTVPQDGFYKVSGFFQTNYYYYTSTPEIISGQLSLGVTHYILINGTTSHLLNTTSSALVPNAPTIPYRQSENFYRESNSIFLSAGDTIQAYSLFSGSNNGAITSSTILASMYHGGGTWVKFELLEDMEEGDSFNWAEKSDDEIAVFDIVMDIFKTFNCYVRTNQATKTVYAEPRDNFYKPLSDAVNKTDAIDGNKQLTLEYNSKTYKDNHQYSYANDSNDAYLNEKNKVMESDWMSYKHVYPDKFKDGTSPYKLSVMAATYTMEDNYMIMGSGAIGFSSGSLAGLYTSRLWNDADSMPIHSDDFAPRLLYFAYGSQSALLPVNSRHLLNYKGVALEDIPYGLPFSIRISGAYNYAPVDGNLSFSDVSTIAENGLWQEYFSKTSQEIEDGKRLNINMLFDLADWVSFDFRDIIYFDNRYPEVEGYWRVEKIKGYKPTSNAISTSIDLVQARTYPKVASGNLLNPLDTKSGRYGLRLGGGGKNRTATRQSNIPTTIIGQNNYAVDNSNFVVGNGLRSSGQNQTIIGTYNEDNSTDIFQLGGGTNNDNRRSIIRVDENGNVFIMDSPVDDVTDHHGGFYLITEYQEITIKENKQMVNFNGLEILGTLNINGDLILR